MPWKIHKKRHLTSFQVIILGFAGVILFGALILMLPISSVQGIITPFHKALFTSTSAVCVTGLAVVDTGSYWSVFGQTVIMFLIQIGGLGVITTATAVFILSGRKISIMQRSTMQNAISAPKVGGIVRLMSFILKGTLLIELIGALFMMPVFCHDFGLRGIWMAIFHSVSAFCNAGFDLLGTKGHPFVSLTSYAVNPGINIVIMLLIIIGGIGFFTWEDIYLHKFHFKHYHMQSKVILTTTLCLILLPAVFFFFQDYGNLSGIHRLLASLFQAVTPRTAGFNTTDLSMLTGASKAMMILLMLIGGSPSSTAGGMKTTTFALLLLNVLATFQSCDDVTAFGRRIDASVIKNATTIAMMYFILFFAGGMTISVYEGLPLSSCLADSVMAGRKAAAEELVKAGVSTEAAAAGISRIINLRDSMRGAMLLDADTGLRVDSLGERGVRVSKMDCDNSERYEARLLEKGLFGDHVREALVLASKVASAVGVVAELCWSDDPEYVTGYVASAKYGYKRIPVLKEYGNPIGGRVFFVEQGTDVQKLITYLQDQVVLIRPEDK